MQLFHARPCRGILRTCAALLIGAAAIFAAHAQKSYDTGATDTTIKIGHLVPYSGPVSAYGTIGKSAGAWFDKVNAEGGINGRKVQFISLDDAYTPSKTVEQARKLVEQDEVLLLFGTLGTAHNMAIRRYMNARKVPQLFVASGATRFGDPKDFPWTMGWQPTYQTEGLIYAEHILKTRPDAKIAILMQNDDFGKDFLKGFLDGLGDKARRMVVAQSTYEVTDPTIDSQMVNLKASGADTFFNISTPKFAAQAIRKAADIGWKPTQYLSSVSMSVSAVIKPAGYENAQGVISATYLRDPADERWKNTRELEDYKAFMARYYPGGDVMDSNNVLGYSSAQTLEHVLRQAGDNLTRENIMKIAANLSLTLPMLYPGIDVKTSANDFYPIERMQLLRFAGTRFEPVGPVMGR
ncbi:ABC transporter substrate-binding protein [Variovorax ginsengisoli]|uniref:ABC-type branched-subunit amino acid transport system substrate-binding protein n=1 Tax=Variovorax ginsengisoli TaxID=363844 RepID=A0ABT9S9N1_9BURK|nr:ABC transporter substrate-binding protein [Variovorax ginsengisoli]MDP9901064.1 ABC-type branched-subunit amino acid transport system substrate-binding protein [Variovorax ginsengisoli]